MESHPVKFLSEPSLQFGKFGRSSLSFSGDLAKGFDKFIKFASENPFLWTGMKDASAESRK
jgi:hypothetical protein